MDKLVMSIHIKSPIETVFEYTTNPANTNKWIEFVKEEKFVGSTEPKVGTIYENISNSGESTIFEINKIEKNVMFHFKTHNSKYELMYFYNRVSENETILTYYEFMSDGTDLDCPFEMKYLDKLKDLLEN